MSHDGPIEFQIGTRKECWVRAPVHCPSCGHLDVWREIANPGDIYFGTLYLCRSVSCEALFYLPHGAQRPNDELSRQRLMQLQIRD